MSSLTARIVAAALALAALPALASDLSFDRQAQQRDAAATASQASAQAKAPCACHHG
jgi:hypothetical protein